MVHLLWWLLKCTLSLLNRLLVLKLLLVQKALPLSDSMSMSMLYKEHYLHLTIILPAFFTIFIYFFTVLLELSLSIFSFCILLSSSIFALLLSFDFSYFLVENLTSTRIYLLHSMVHMTKFSKILECYVLAIESSLLPFVSYSLSVLLLCL